MVLQFARTAFVAGAVAAGALAVLSAPAWAQAAPKPAPSGDAGAKPADPVVATVNGAAIHLSDMIAARQDLPAQYQSMPVEVIYPGLLERLVDGKLLSLQGRKEGLAKDPEVKARMAQIEDQVIQGVYLTRTVKAKMTDAMLKKAYQDYLKANPPETEAHVRHILFKTEGEAKDAIKQLKGGADFAELAKKSSDTGSAGRGGDLGFIKRADVVEEFSVAAFALKPGQYTDAPVKTEFGWHVIKVEEVRQSKPPTFEEAKEEIERASSQQMVVEIVQNLRKSAKIARFKPDGSPMPESGAGAAPDAGAGPDKGDKK